MAHWSSVLRWRANAATGVAVALLVTLGSSCGRTSDEREGASGGEGGGGGAADTGGGGASSCAAPDPTFLAQYDACTAATNQASCETVGGSWERIGALPVDECQCSTGQGDCPCSRGSECLSGYCLGTGSYECSATGTCSAVAKVKGCYCFLDGQSPTFLRCND